MYVECIVYLILITMDGGAIHLYQRGLEEYRLDLPWITRDQPEGYPNLYAIVIVKIPIAIDVIHYFVIPSSEIIFIMQSF